VTPDRTDANPDENAEHGVLDESGNLDTASITILGGHIAQVSVDLPVADDDDLDDDVIEDEIPFDDADIAALDAPYPHRDPAEIEADEIEAGEVDVLDTDEIILEPHPEAPSADVRDDHEVHDADVLDDTETDGAETDGAETDDAGAGVAEAGVADAETDADVETDADAETPVPEHVDAESDGVGSARGEDADAHDAPAPAADDEPWSVIDLHTDDEPHAPVEDAPTEGASAEEASSEGAPAEEGAATGHASADDAPEGDGSAEHDASEWDGAADDHAAAADDAPEVTASAVDAPEAGDDVADSDVSDDDSADDSADDHVAEDLHDAEIVDDVELFEADAAAPLDDAPLDDEGSSASAEPLTHAPWVPAETAGAVPPATSDQHADDQHADDEPADDAPADDAPADSEVVVAAIDADDEHAAHRASASASAPAPAHAPEPAGADAAEAPTPFDEMVLTARVAEPAASSADDARPATDTAGDAPIVSPPVQPAATATGSVPTTRAERAATGVIGTVPLTRRRAHQAEDAARATEEAARVDRAHAMERVRTPAPEVTLTSKRIGQIDDTRESSDLLTADRLLDPRQIARPEPEGLFQQLVYSVSRHRINLGDGRRARERKDLDRRIAAPLSGGARFVPVLSRKGGVGKTTVTSLLGMALADARDDRIIAVDANPDRGTLADRVGRPNGRTVRDLVRAHDEMAGYNDVSSIVARDATRLDVLASDADPRVSEAFSDDDYRQVADVAAHYYSIVLTDTGTGIVHSVMGATLELADTLVIVAGLSVDEARLASETLTWLETNGYAARVRDAVVVLNNSRPGTPLVRESELEAHFRSRVRTVIRMPYDARIAAGSAITFRDLQPSTRQAARELAAAVVEGLRTPVAAA